MRDLFKAIGVTIISCILIGYSICMPMGKSEAFAILSERGGVISAENSLRVFISTTPLPLELEALSVICEDYAIVYIETFEEDGK